MTHNTRGIEEINNYLDDTVHKTCQYYVYSDLKDLVANIEVAHHQELQKARDAIFQELPNGEVAIHIPAEFKDKPLWVVSNNSKVLLHHSELDQDTELLNSVKEDWDKQAKNAMNGLDQDVSK